MWSTCSNNHMRNLDLECLENKPGQPEQDHNRYKNNPGQQWDADSQCQLLMFTSEARMDHGAHNLHEICHSLKCRAQVIVIVIVIVIATVSSAARRVSEDTTGQDLRLREPLVELTRCATLASVFRTRSALA